MVFLLFIKTLFILLYFTVDYNNIILKIFNLILFFFFAPLSPLESKLESNCIFFVGEGWIERKVSNIGGKLKFSVKNSFEPLIFFSY